jgi:hypothetical protein
LPGLLQQISQPLHVCIDLFYLSALGHKYGDVFSSGRMGFLFALLG